jgi:hypothetical protein
MKARGASPGDLVALLAATGAQTETRSTKPCPDCHRFDDGRFDLGAVYRRPVAGRVAVHYAMIIILAMGIGLFAPPFGVGYYAACAIGRIDPAEGIRPIWGYLQALLVGLIVVAIFPWMSIGFL